MQPVKAELKVEMLDIEPESPLPNANLPPSTTITATSSTNSSKDDTSKKRTEEFVDLTLSDSDDEPLLPKKKQSPPDSSIQNNVSYSNVTNNNSNMSGNSVSSSGQGQHSPSLIILDGDSPPATPISNAQVPPRSYSAASTASCHSYLPQQNQFLDMDGDSFSRY